MSNVNKNADGNILFEYSCIPAYGCVGIDCGFDDGGFTVSIYADGSVTYSSGPFGGVHWERDWRTLSEDSVVAIQKLLEDNQTDIAAFDENPYNGSYDGEGNFFVFNGKKISTWNISHTDEERWKLVESEEIYSALQQENKVLSIFDAVADILRNDGVKLSLYGVDLGTNEGIKNKVIKDTIQRLEQDDMWD